MPWLIFIDTNILLDFYRLGGASASRQLSALERHKGAIITCDQVRMEFMKNRQKVIVDCLKNISKPAKTQVPPIISESQPAKMLLQHLDTAIANYMKVKRKIEQILQNPSQHDPVYRALNRLFSHTSPFNLKRNDDTRHEIRNLARKRFELGYPPRKQTDTSIGDAVNWEWIVRCAEKSNENHNVLIVSRDSDYGTKFGDDAILNDWLRKEFKERVSRKRRIELTSRLTTALKRLDEQVTPEDTTEEDKIIDEGASQYKHIVDILLDESAWERIKREHRDQHLSLMDLGSE